MCKRILIAALSCALLFAMPTVASSQAQQLSPTETVRQFYKSMREKKYKEAFALSIYKPAIDGLSAKELEELRPDFERMAAEIPDTMELSGETISGELATVFVKVKGDGKTEPEEKLAPIPLMKANGAAGGITGKPDRWVARSRSVISRSPWRSARRTRTDGINSRTGVSSATAPSCTMRESAAAVNVLVTDPI